MVLQECPNESGRCAMVGCKAPEAPSHQWPLLEKGDRGGVKICRQCDRDRRKDERDQRKAQGGSSSSKRQREDEDAEDECAGDTLVHIIEILQTRRVHGL